MLPVTDIRASGAILNTDEVNALCVDSCYTSLESARTTIKGVCTASTDVIVYNNIAYPGIHLCSRNAV